MHQEKNKLSQFWQELKRRKVVRVITVYAASAFVILELVDIIAPNLRLPSWTFNLVLILLCVGFIIAIILSWIYDILPEGGIIKTEPAKEVKSMEIPKSSNSWRIASYISFVVIAALIILNVIPRSERSGSKKNPNKSIAVLPFTSLSEDPEKQYIADGVMDAILLHLSKIEDLRVMSRTSVEQFRVTDKTVTEICQELDVAFLLEGSFRKYGEQARLIVQLIQPGKEGHAWAKQYDRDWSDIFAVESEVAQSIARELKAVISNEEKQLIEKIPTSNLTAYDFYQRGNNEHWKYWLDDDKKALERAENLYHQALGLDSTYAQAYTGLADVHWDKHYWEDYFSEDFLDSFLILTNIALSYDNELSEAYRFKGAYYRQIGKPERALKEYYKALEYNPNDWRAYTSLASMYSEEPIKQIENYRKALSLNHGPQKPASLRNLGRAYLDLGFIEKAKYYAEQAFTLDGDSLSYLRSLIFAKFSRENIEESLKLGRELLKFDSTFLYPLIFNLTGNHQELYSYYTKQKELQNSYWIIVNKHRIGVALRKMGEFEEAENFFNQQVKYNLESIELGRASETSKVAYYDLAAAYACLGEKQKACFYLNEVKQRRILPLWWVVQLKIDPLFENIRDEPAYQQIVKEMETRYQAEHERVRKWLEENDML